MASFKVMTFFWGGPKKFGTRKVALYFSCVGPLFCEATTAYYIRKYTHKLLKYLHKHK